MNYKWDISEYDRDAFDRLVGSGLTPLLAAVLCSRGYDTGERAEGFLSEGRLYDPMSMRDMDRAAARIRRAVSSGEHIAVYGDYDVDGITSVCLLMDWLRSAGAVCSCYIPDRIGEGYGLNPGAVDRLYARGARLLVTVDCGVTGVAETEYAKSLGMDVIITDHHECQDRLPDAEAVVNPRRADCTYANKDLAGVGVAFKLVCALDGDGERMLERYGDLAAVGTVADVVSVTGENRLLVRRGIDALRRTRRPGLRRLMKEAGIDPGALTSATIGYVLSPRINAAGRMGEVSSAVDLLLTGDEEEAGELAAKLCGLNRRRQQLENEMLSGALGMLGDHDGVSPIVLASPDWHQGVAGIVASSLAERFCLPTVILCMEGDRGKGSCRSFGGFNIFECLRSLSGCLEAFGGHEYAAGLSIPAENLPAFRRAFAEYYLEKTRGAAPERTLRIDFTVDMPEMLTVGSVGDLKRLEPCGVGNERPLLCMTGARLEQIKAMGGGKHMRARVSKFGRSYSCVCFSKTPDDFAVEAGDAVDLAFCPQINDYRGSRTVQLMLVDLIPGDFERRALLSLSLFDSYKSGARLEPQELALLCPEREDFVQVWRRLRSRPGGLSGGTARILSILSGGKLPACRAMTCLDVFSELGLVELRRGDGRLDVTASGGGRKVDLESSDILKKLKFAIGGSNRT